MNSEVVERFLKYVSIHTTSQEGIDKIPSTDRQFNLGKLLVDEIKSLGYSDVKLTEKGVVIATIPSNLPDEITQKIPIICFNSHIDTSPAAPGENVHPRIVKFTGEPIYLENNLELSINIEEIPDLSRFINSELIITDGTTLLGADDKAGIAEIMTALSFLSKNSEIKHGTIKIVFTPDEEVGKGADSISVSEIGAKYGYTIDGGRMGGIEIENFNAASGKIVVKGYNVHPGSAFGKMKNSMHLVPEILSLFPPDQAPETTKDYEPYYYPIHLQSSTDETKLMFILRNFDEQDLERQINHIKEGVRKIQSKHPDFPIEVKIKKSYRNMKVILDQYPEVVQIAKKAIQLADLEVIEEPIRGGTDGARFSFEGMPTPNIFTGGYNFHSKKEFIPIPAMEKAVQVILNIIKLFVEKYS
ncbi:MAG: peptidase T [Candidatus Lokiarchaeota archaeon]|nr:peptidase T [Candidatus Harpocratesius repetitus]